MQQRPGLPFSIRAGWAVGSIVTTTLIFITNTFFLRFMTDYIGLAAALAGTLLAATKIVDACINPVMGLVSDNTQSRWGRRRPYLLAGTLLGALSLILMFNVPMSLTGALVPAYVFAVLVLVSVAYTAFNVPYLAMMAEMTSNPQERALLVSYRVYALAAAQFIVGGGAPLLVERLGADRPAYGGMSMVLALMVIAVGLVAFFSTRRAPVTELQAAAKSRFWSALPTLFRSRLYVAVVLVKATFLIGSTAHTATATYYVRYVMQASESTLSLFLLVYSLGMVASQALWLKLIGRTSKVFAFMGAASIYTIVSIIWAFLGAHVPTEVFILLSAINGIGAGGLLLTSESMLPDAIEDDYRLSGLRREGTLASLFTFAEKGANAIGIAGVGFALSFYGYVAPPPGETLSEAGLQAILFAFGLMPAIFVGASTLWLLILRRRRAAATAS
ncbi:MAG TPA: MFS transporter [Pedomonas sp.]|uniref:MFS transporter n=1 Tax=Pedomonas sp. TaxID=2976421 RepID=UPI002F3FEB32